MRYALAKYAVAADDDISAWKAIGYSVKLTKDRRLDFLILEISLLGWRILDFLILPRLFTTPYILTVYSLYARYLIELDNMEKAEKQKAAEHQQPQDVEQQPKTNEPQPREEVKQTEA